MRSEYAFRRQSATVGAFKKRERDSLQLGWNSPELEQIPVELGPSYRPIHPVTNMLLQYGDVLGVERSNGQLLMGRLESNAKGKALRDWSVQDVEEWVQTQLEEALLNDRIEAALKGRDGPGLLEAPRNLKKSSQLDDADLQQLIRCLQLRFEFELVDPKAYLSNAAPSVTKCVLL
eukprot:182989-Prymnesium_polylepis.4